MEGLLAQYDSNSHDCSDDDSSDDDSASMDDKGLENGSDIDMAVFNAGPAERVEPTIDASVARVVPGPAERAAVRASAPVVDPFARMINASKRPAVSPPKAPLRGPAFAGNAEPPQPSLAEAAAAVAAASAAGAEARILYRPW